ncbi:Organic hydroperoxide resistance transcriptional regulator [Virgibacillus dokdonensis]|uniref:Organic hydroperoxide resistance transcriptional regulator n=2 Tax=Virgibacillus dokdonensis TaxID=302167 RepID=A0A2K9J2D4_9BACI|nr:Organic hydroperoxide resistance transcriptional regulator [Virgibacillus dokdonensis]
MKSYETEETINRIEKRMRYISGIIKKNGRKILHNYPITSPQFIALQWLLEEGDLTIGELSNRISLAFSTTTDLVDRMEKNGLVERVRDAKDRRVVRIHVLEKGKTIIHEVVEKRQEYLGQVLEEFSDDQIDQLHELLAYLHEQMKEKEQK